uniref:CSON004164 protein n=1 Tax=Culicoides sonorensis TaxID=179676 RepID=A0A336MQ97_CULSO
MDLKLKSTFYLLTIVCALNNVETVPVPASTLPINLDLAQNLLSDSVKRIISIFQNPQELTSRMQKLGQQLFEHEISNIRDIIGILVEEYNPEDKKPNVKVSLPNNGGSSIGSNESGGD